MMLVRETNRHHGTPAPVPAAIIGLLEAAARREGARLQLLTARDEIDKAATILATAGPYSVPESAVACRHGVRTAMARRRLT